MIPIKLNHQTYFFSIVHVTRQSPDQLIYGILINSESYYLSKSVGVEDCIQLDSKPLLDHKLFFEICKIITRFEIIHQEYPALEFINIQIIKALDLIRTCVLPIHKK